MPREYLSSRGEPESKERKHLIEIALRIEDTKEEVKDKELDEGLSKINFEELRSIFTELCLSCGIKPDDINFLGRDAIFIKNKVEVNGRDCAGSYFPIANSIGISSTTMKELWYGERLPIALLHALIHEEVHAVSDQKSVGFFEALQLKGQGLSESVNHKYISRDGYSIHSTETKGLFKKQQDETDQFRFFNEGAVEHLARSITQKYFERDKDFAPVKKMRAYFKSLTSERGVSAYGLPLLLCEELVKKISSYAGVAPEIVWQGLYRGLIEGLDLTDKRIRKIFYDCLPQNFWDRLESAQTVEDWSAILADLRKGKFVEPNNIKQKVLDWLRE